MSKPETITLTNSNVSSGMIIELKERGEHSPAREATVLFNALAEHLPGTTMTELYRQFVKNARLFDAAAPDLLASCEKLLAYRKRVGAINFQLEKADDYLRLIEQAIETAKESAPANTN